MRTAPPDLPGSQTTDSPVDRALALMLADEGEAALRWAAAVVEHDVTPSALILTCRLLADAGRTEAATEGLELAVKQAIDAGNLPLAVAAVADLRQLGRAVDRYFDEIAASFCVGSSRLSDISSPPPPLPNFETFQPMSSFLAGPALLSKATSIVHGARERYQKGRELPPIAPLPFFSALEMEGLRALIAAFEMITVPAGQAVIVEGEEGAEAYIVARGELEVRRKPPPDDGGDVTLARLVNGSLFGEMALLSRTPRAASVVACRPSILLVARRDALEKVAQARPDVGIELAAHCRRRMVANLVRTSRVLIDVHPDARPALVERFETCVFEKGEKLIRVGEEASGLHLIASGEVAVVGYEPGEEPLVISTLGAGEVVGEVALVLRRKAVADVVAVHPTVTLHLPREDFISLIKDHPAILGSLYLSAIQRDDETTAVIANATTRVTDDYILV
ncbi:cyclic nucleotide-binding domain-containing protein [Pendulispora brunnea]|uniref:Cyclic nucleotide-binding domain-containing protein n=1 Tax=Pendulispora brunnea TaxID=2905690 RepID=A0ABZ2KEY8_9BACT